MGAAHFGTPPPILTPGDCRALGPGAYRNGFARAYPATPMLARRPVAIRDPPSEFDELVAWFDQLAANLVLLEDYPREDLRFAVDAVDRAVRAHVRAFDERDGCRANVAPGLAPARAALDGDHARFFVSLDQLAWSFRIVEREDHGGHRQALGQYGRVLTEALRRHRQDERAYLAAFGPGKP